MKVRQGVAGDREDGTIFHHSEVVEVPDDYFDKIRKRANECKIEPFLIVHPDHFKPGGTSAGTSCCRWFGWETQRR